MRQTRCTAEDKDGAARLLLRRCVFDHLRQFFVLRLCLAPAAS